MQSKCQADQFYVLYKNKSYYGSIKEYHFSIAGLMFLSELVFAGIEAAGIDPTKATIRIDKKYDDKPTLAVSFPSPKTRLLHSIQVIDGDIVMHNNKPDPSKKKRKNSYGYYNSVKRDSRKFPLADPNLSQNIAEFIKLSLPKKSIYAVEEPVTVKPAPDA